MGKTNRDKMIYCAKNNIPFGIKYKKWSDHIRQDLQNKTILLEMKEEYPQLQVKIRDLI